MRVKNIHLAIQDTETTLQLFAATLAKARKGMHVANHEGVTFESMETLRKVLTQKRFELLHIIKRHEPDSIYALAKVANRDIKSVNTDLSILSELGLVYLEAKRQARKKTKPIVEFDKINVEITI